jgi:integrase
LAEIWYEEIDLAVRAGDRSPGTGRLYRDRIDNQVVPGMGALRLREVTVARVDRLLKTVRERHGVSVSWVTRKVLSGMFGLAARHDAVPFNPVRDAAPLRAPAKEKHALTLDEVREMRARLAADQRAVDWDLPDLVDIMFATGLRIGEACAIT